MSLSIHGPTFQMARRFSPSLVETGTHVGGGILGALLAGFERIYTCDLSAEMIAEAQVNMGTGMGRVSYFWGSSGEMLPKMLAQANADNPAYAAAVLLDAHAMDNDDRTHAEGASTCPLREELDALRQSARRDHLVLVDDIDLCGTRHLANIGQAEVERRLLDINPGYRFEITHGVRRDMMLIAIPPGFKP